VISNPQPQHFHLRRRLGGLAPGRKFGCVQLVKELQPSTMFFPIVRTDSGIVKLVNELQPAKANFPILVTESGTVKLVKE